MARETITLRTIDPAASSVASADVTRIDPAVRAIKAVLFIAGGILGGAACIIVPVLHLVTTWALPLLGILAGLRTLKTHAVIRDIQGTCPKCEKPVEFQGGAASHDLLRAECPACRAALVVAADERKAENGE